MGNQQVYHDTYRDAYNAVRNAREEYDKRLKFLQRYEGSKGYEEDLKSAREEFEGKLEGIRAAARGGFDLAFKGMEKNTAPADTLDVPTEEMVRVLQTLDLRDTFTMNELERAARTCQDSETALRTLEGIARKKGVLPELGKDPRTGQPTQAYARRYRSTADQARDVLGTLKDAANSLMQWDGRSREEIMRERVKANHGKKWGFAEGEEPVEEKDLPPIGTAWVEEHQAGLTPTHTLETIVGKDAEGNLNCSPAALSFLD